MIMIKMIMISDNTKKQKKLNRVSEEANKDDPAGTDGIIIFF